MTDWKAKNVGVSVRRGESRTKRVEDERDGSTAGYHIEHWDDHQDAVVTPKTIRVKAKIQED
jgi:hypothetical protein